MWYVQQTTLQNKVDWPKETCAGQETIPSMKQRPKHQLKRESERLSNCQMWITYQQTHILLKASLSCTFFLSTTKPWSRWSSKDEVQRWDTCPEPTELRLFGCSTESTWNQRSKLKTLTPKPTCWHSNQREFHAWRVEPSSSFVQHDEFLDFLLQSFKQFSFWSDRKAERHVKERSRSDFQLRFTDGETKANEFGDDGEVETHESGVA